MIVEGAKLMHQVLHERHSCVGWRPGRWRYVRVEVKLYRTCRSLKVMQAPAAAAAAERRNGRGYRERGGVEVLDAGESAERGAVGGGGT